MQPKYRLYMWSIYILSIHMHTKYIICNLNNTFKVVNMYPKPGFMYKCRSINIFNVQICTVIIFVQPNSSLKQVYPGHLDMNIQH